MCFNILSGEYNFIFPKSIILRVLQTQYNKEIDLSSYTKLNPRRCVTHEFLHEYLKNGARMFICLWSTVSAVLQICRPYIYIPRLKI
jgi:hypothetical protein